MRLRSCLARGRSALPAVLAVLLAVLGRADAAHADEKVWALLKKPGHIVLLRHSPAPGSVSESNDMNFKDCSIQRNLDDAGRAQARRIGEAFRKHGIRRARILSSQYCRTMETGRLMKLGPVTETPVLNQVVYSRPSEMREAGAKGLALLKKISKKQLTILVSHVTNIQSIAGVSLSSGEFAVVHFDKAGKLVVDGRIEVP